MQPGDGIESQHLPFAGKEKKRAQQTDRTESECLPFAGRERESTASQRNGVELQRLPFTGKKRMGESLPEFFLLPWNQVQPF